jgi:hypothetical protein
MAEGTMFGILAAGLCAIWLLTAPARAFEPVVTLIPASDPTQIAGTTNLPDGTSIGISGGRRSNGVVFDFFVKIHNGRFITPSIGSPDYPATPGDYRVMITTTSDQPTNVVKIFGKYGELLTGPNIDYTIMPSYSQTFAFHIPGTPNPRSDLAHAFRFRDAEAVSIARGCFTFHGDKGVDVFSACMEGDLQRADPLAP